VLSIDAVPRSSPEFGSLKRPPSQHRWFEAAWFPVWRSCQPRKAAGRSRGNRRVGFPSPPVGFPNTRGLINILIDPRRSGADGEVLVALMQVRARWGSPPYGNRHALRKDSGRAIRRPLAYTSGYQANFADSNVAWRKP